MERLAPGLAASLARAETVITSTPQQAFQIRLAWAVSQRGRGLEQWATPDVLPFGAWLTRAWQDAFAADVHGRVPALLTRIQEQTLWESIVAGSAAAESWLQPFGAANAARRAWRRVQDWAIEPAALARGSTVECAAFARWVKAFSDQTRERDWIDAGRAQWRISQVIHPDRVTPWQGAGFDSVTPALQALAGLRAASGPPTRFLSAPGLESRPVRLAAPDADAELQMAASWARARLSSDPRARLLVIIRDLEARRGQVAEWFDSMLRPGSLLLGERGDSSPYAIEGGQALDSYPLVQSALTTLALTCEAVAFDAMSRWLRSPYLLEGRKRTSERARIDERLRKALTPEVTASQLLRGWPAAASRLGSSDPLLECLRLAQQAGRGRKSLSAWSGVIGGLLRTLGWPGERLDSAEQQTLEKFTGALGDLATLDELVGEVPLGHALRHLRRVLRETPFQPETGDAAVTVTGRLGDPGLAYDGIWIAGLHEGAWPAAPQPDPFIPWELQRAAGMPEATAEGSRMAAEEITARLLASAPEVICTWPARLDDEECLPSPLLAPLPAVEMADLGIARRAGYWNLIHGSARLETLQDSRAPALARAARLPGGARALQLQSLCPFRAFAQQRLRAERLDTPPTGIDPPTRGKLVHFALALLWQELQSSESLRSTSAQARGLLVERIAAAAAERVLAADPRWPRELVVLERERLTDVLMEFLELELARPTFRVLERELRVQAQFGGLDVRLQIDRIDELADGRRLLIDYKTGEVAASGWEGIRPEDPQLPLYAVALQAPPAAIAFGVVRTGECAFKGISSRPAAFPKAATVDDWQVRLTQWRQAIERLAGEFAAGHAAVDPRNPPQTCRLCHLQALCRIEERIALAGRDEDDGE